MGEAKAFELFLEPIDVRHILKLNIFTLNKTFRIKRYQPAQCAKERSAK